MVCFLLHLQAGESASGDMLAVKDAHIAALHTELRGKDRMLRTKTRVCTLPTKQHVCILAHAQGNITE